eukprot:6880744-Prymnesium_polylepis.1
MEARLNRVPGSRGTRVPRGFLLSGNARRSAHRDGRLVTTVRKSDGRRAPLSRGPAAAGGRGDVVPRRASQLPRDDARRGAPLPALPRRAG